MPITCWATHDGSNRFHMTDELDCLPPDAIGGIFRYEYDSPEEALECARRVEGASELIFQVGDIFYESDFPIVTPRKR